MNIPSRVIIANLPTKIEKLERLTKQLGGPNIYIKRDDQTGSEISGNKIRKLEFSVKEAIDNGCDTLITCGGIQSNHARATAAVAARLGMNSHLVLRGDKESQIDGNLFLDKLLGAQIHYISAESYRNRRFEIMNEIKNELLLQGYNAYIIPEGASNGIGSFGYLNAVEEIIIQQQQMGIFFDAIVSAVGSGGTYAGLFIGNKVLGNNANVYGINVCDDEEYFKNRISEIIVENIEYTENNVDFSKDEIKIIDGYVGRGYALSRSEELEFIYDFAKLEGIILDPVYTGKAMFGLVEEIKKRRFESCKNILFIHTGGMYGLFPQKELFNF